MRETDQEPGDDRPAIEQALKDALARSAEEILARAARRCDVAAFDPLPANCPFTKRLPKKRDHIADAIEDGVIPCCRIERPSWLDRSEAPLCRVEGEEVYRFLYKHAFGRHGIIRFAKRRDEITVERSYYPGRFDEPERFAALLTEADWDRLQAALAAANFWSLPRVVHSRGCWLEVST